MNCANHPDRERQAFCQNCGKPLCRECARVVGQAVFCEPCLEARLAAANAATGAIPKVDPPTFGAGPTSGSASYHTVPGAGTGYRYPGGVDGVPYDVSGVPPRPGMPNPAVAALLGFIPGVGAMYNGQYAKGIVHLIIFAVLISLADQNSIFGLFITAWVFYQAIEAYHTARARRDGTALPNPFGLNDIGERFGFGRAWPGPGAAPSVQTSANPYTSPTPSPFSPDPAAAPPAAAPYTPPQPLRTPEQPAYIAPPPPSWSDIPDPYRAATPADPVFTPASSSASLPIGAVVLIGLGLLFLLGNTHWLGNLPIHILLPALLIGVGVWIFFRHMQRYGGIIDNGSPAYRLRVLQALHSSVWIVLVGILFLLDSLRILSWGRSWPLFIIVAGVLVFLRRAAAGSFAQVATMPVTGFVPPAGQTSAPPSQPSPEPPPFRESERP